MREGSGKIRAAEKNIGRVRVSMDGGIVGLIAIETGLHIRIENPTDNMLLALEDEAVACPVVRIDMLDVTAAEIVHEGVLLLIKCLCAGDKAEVLDGFYQKRASYEGK